MGDDASRSVEAKKRRSPERMTAKRARERTASTPHADPDRDVVEQVRQGDVAGAVVLLMRRHGTAVHRYCCEALRDPTLADDVHQQVFIEALRDLPRFAGRAPVRIWLFAIARNRVLDAVKKRRRTRDRIEDIEVTELFDSRPSPIDLLDDAQLGAALAASVGELDEPVRTTLLLHYQQGFTFEEMAVICRKNAGTLNARVARALPRLRARIEARLRPPTRRQVSPRRLRGLALVGALFRR
jgi:RNA polymerase sigma-70 factor, ECF subfamily